MIKKIDIKEFRELGFLQEVNRLFFHPLGLALEATVDDVTGEETLSGVWDFRDDPEGIIFDESMINEEFKAKIRSVSALLESKREAREKLLGGSIFQRS